MKGILGFEYLKYILFLAQNEKFLLFIKMGKIFIKQYNEY